MIWLTLLFAVTVEQCLGPACTTICRGAIVQSAPTSLTDYRVLCPDGIFTDSFEAEE